MHAPETALTEIPSPDKNYCVCLFGLPTPEDEPQRLTFTLYRNQNGVKQALFELPEDYYCTDGVDCIKWDNGSTAITYTVNHFKSIFIYDFIFQIKKEHPVPDQLVKSYWDAVRSTWIIKSLSRTEEFSMYYSDDDVRDFIAFPWKSTQIELSNSPAKEYNNRPLYKVFFMNTDQNFRYAEITDSLFVYNPTLITISENGQARIPVCNAYLTMYSCLICDLAQFGHGDNFIVKKEDPQSSPISLPIKVLPQDQSPFYSVRQDYKRLDESGVTQYLALEFINKETGKVHYSYQRRKDSKGQWNNDRTKFFFDGSEDMLEEDDIYYNNNERDYAVFVVLDVKNKTCIKEYRGNALHPRWNEEGTDVVFDNKLELLEIAKAHKAEEARIRKEETENAIAKREEEEQLRKEQETLQRKVIPEGPPFYVLPSPDGIHCVYQTLNQLHNPQAVQATCIPPDNQLSVCAVETPEHPHCYQVCVMDADQKRVFSRIDPYRIDFKHAIRQSGNTVCFYGIIPGSADSYIVCFDLKDIYTEKELLLSVWNLHKPIVNYTWNSAKARWYPVIDGKEIHPAPFFYDDQYMESVPITL